MRYCPQQASTATWSKISPSESIYLASVASSSCKYQQLSWMLKSFPRQKMKHQVNLYSFLAYHRGPWVQALCALDSFWSTQCSIPWSHSLLICLQHPLPLLGAFMSNCHQVYESFIFIIYSIYLHLHLSFSFIFTL